MGPLRWAAKFDPFLPNLQISKIAPPTLHPGAIQGQERIKFCRLATLILLPQNRRSLLTDEILLQLSALRNLLDKNGDPLVDNYRPVQAIDTHDVYHYTVA